MYKSEWEAACSRNDTCALTGSAAFFLGIPGTSVLINGPLWCYFYAMRYLENAAGLLSDRLFCTQPAGTAVVYGTEDDVLAGLELVKRTKLPERLLIENNCSISMIGDDLSGIAAKAGLPFPVYTLDSGGIHGGFAGGWERGLLRVISEMKPGDRIPASVNLLGATPFLLKGKEDAAEIRRLLALAGYQVIAAPGAGSSWEEITNAPRAAMNLVLRDELGLRAAEQMKEQWGIPYLSVGLPYGMQGTRRWMQQITDVFPGGSLHEIDQEIMEAGTRMHRLGSDMESLWGPLWFDSVLIAALPSEAAGLAEALRSEWVDTGRLDVQLQHESTRLIPAADAVLTCGKDEEALHQVYTNWEGGLLLGSSHEASRLIRLKKNFEACNIAYPSYTEMFLSDVPFCGLRGAAGLYERLWNCKLRQQYRMGMRR